LAGPEVILVTDDLDLDDSSVSVRARRPHHKFLAPSTSLVELPEIQARGADLVRR
jgi:hypothetical protein